MQCKQSTLTKIHNFLRFNFFQYTWLRSKDFVSFGISSKVIAIDSQTSLSNEKIRRDSSVKLASYVFTSIIKSKKHDAASATKLVLQGMDFKMPWQCCLSLKILDLDFV